MVDTPDKDREDAPPPKRDDAASPKPASGADLTHWIFGSLGERGRIRGSIQFDVERIEGEGPAKQASAPDAAQGSTSAEPLHRARDSDTESESGPSFRETVETPLAEPDPVGERTPTPQSKARALEDPEGFADDEVPESALPTDEFGCEAASEGFSAMDEWIEEEGFADTESRELESENLDAGSMPLGGADPRTVEDHEHDTRESTESFFEPHGADDADLGAQHSGQGDVLDAEVIDVEVVTGSNPLLPALARASTPAPTSAGPEQVDVRFPFLEDEDEDEDEAAAFEGSSESPAEDVGEPAVEEQEAVKLQSKEDFLNWLDSIDGQAAEAGAQDQEDKEGEPEEAQQEDKEFDEPSEQRFVETLLETLMLFGLVIVGELAATGRVGSYAVHPHPYWLVVIPMAAARGVPGALLSAIVAAFFYAIGARAAHAGDFMSILDLKVMQEPMLFVAIGFVVGEFRDAARRKSHALWQAFRQRDAEVELLTQEKELLAEANHSIKRRLVDNASQFGNLIRTATRLEAADEVELFDVALEMIEEHCGATHCAILAVLEGGLLDLAAYRGYEASDLRSLLSGAESSALVARVLETGTRVNGFGVNEALVGEGPLVVAPIADAAGVVRQLLCLDRIPVRAFNDSTVMTFYGIADWVAVTLRRTSHGNQALDFRLGLREAISIGPWVGSAAQLGERIRIEDARCSRQGILSAFVTVQCIGIPADREDETEGWVLDHLLSDLRPTDGVYRFGYPGCFVFVLSGTDPEQCAIVRQRVDERISRAGDLFFSEWETCAFAPDTESPDLESMLPRVADAFRGRSEFALDAEVPVVVDERIEIGRLDDFVRRVRTEWSIAIRNKLELYVLEFRDDEADVKRGSVLSRHVESVARDLLRPTDGVYRSAIARFSIILPGANCEGAFGTLSRFLEGMEQRASSEILERVEAQVYALGSDYHQYERFLARMLGDNLASEAIDEGEVRAGICDAFDEMMPVAEPVLSDDLPSEDVSSAEEATSMEVFDDDVAGVDFSAAEVADSFDAEAISLDHEFDAVLTDPLDSDELEIAFDVVEDDLQGLIPETFARAKDPSRATVPEAREPSTKAYEPETLELDGEERPDETIQGRISAIEAATSMEPEFRPSVKDVDEALELLDDPLALFDDDEVFDVIDGFVTDRVTGVQESVDLGSVEAGEPKPASSTGANGDKKDWRRSEVQLGDSLDALADLAQRFTRPDPEDES